MYTFTAFIKQKKKWTIEEIDMSPFFQAAQSLPALVALAALQLCQ